MDAKTFMKLTPEQKRGELKEDLKMQIVRNNFNALSLTMQVMGNDLIMENEDRKKAVQQSVCEFCTAIIKALE